MIDINLIRKDPDAVKKNLSRRKDPSILKLLEQVIREDKEWRDLKVSADKLRGERNTYSLDINTLKKNGKPIGEAVGNVKKTTQKIADTEAKEKLIEDKIQSLLLSIPNLLDESVPEGKDENDNKVIKEWGKKPTFSFSPRSHVDILSEFGLADIERAGKVAGSRFYYLKNDLVLLELALERFALEHLAKKGFTLFSVPQMLSKTIMQGAVNLADFEDVIYKIEGEDLYLIGTSEHALLGYHANEILPKESLPLRYAGLSTCFRKEAGAHGKDTKGIFRVHQFNKIEQFVFCTPDQAATIHEELIANAEELFVALKIPYRIVNICTADIGGTAAKKYDLEAWMPAQNCYREMVSCSNCTDYQARKLGVKYLDKDHENKREFAYTLNSTAIATTRLMVAILENFQTKDGAIAIPQVLWPSMTKKFLTR